MPAQVVQSAGPTLSMQGVAIPATSVNRDEFFRRTRRHIMQERSVAYSASTGNGSTVLGQPTDIFELRKSDILSEITLRFTGSIVVTPGTGTVASTARWPYDFFKAIRFAANGASNLINASGLKLKVRDFLKNTDLQDRGTQTIGGVSRTAGTLSKASESWGVGSNTSAIAGATYNIDFEVTIPVAEDQVDLNGAIFLQTASSDLTLAVDYEAITNLFLCTGNATVALTGTTQAWTTKYSIPVGPDGEIVVPDLSLFHSLIQSRWTSLANAENEVRLTGQGAGKALLRLFYQHWNGAGTAAAPLPMVDSNFGLQAWRYASNETPDMFISGGHMRTQCERVYSTDVGGLWGFGVHEFATQNALRDVVDLGTTADIRLVSTIASGVNLASPSLEYVIESVFQSGQGA
jgi:hypothetical protein